MALKTPYATILEADNYLDLNDDWNNLDDSQKMNHLRNGRYYIDSHYTCSTIDENDIPEEFVYANVLLAESDLSSGIFSVDKTGNNAIVKKSVKAGEVESEITYAGSRSTSLRLNSIDPFPAITSLLDGFCTIKSNNSIKISTLSRV